MKWGRFLRGSAVAAGLVMAAPVAAQIAPPPIEAYGELPTLERMAISPSGKLAMLTTSENKRVIIALDEELQPITAMEVGDIKVRDLRWIGDGAIMVERSDTQDLGERFIARNAEFYNAMVIPVDGSAEVHTVFADDKSVLNAVFGTYGLRKIGGKWIGYFAGAPMKMGQRGQYFYDGAAPALYAVDMASNKARRVTSSPGENEYSSWLIDADGEVAATLVFNGLTDGWRLANARGQEIASGSKPDGSATVVVFSADGSKAIYKVSPDYGDSEYFQVPLDGSGPPERIYEDIEIAALYYDPDTNRMTGYRPEDDDGEAEPVFFDPGRQQTVGKVISSFRSANGSLRGYTGDFGRMLLRTAGNNDSGSWFLVDTKAGQASMIGRERPLIKPNQVGPISTITYKAQDGLEIEAVLTLPPGRPAKNLPVIVLPHGGPRAHDAETFDWWAQAFASRGYAVLQPNFRGSTGYGDDFLKAGNGQWGRKMQTDLSDGLKYLAEQGTVDPGRACIMGASYGGYAALAGVTLQNGIYRCSVAVAGVADLKMSVDQDYRESGSKDLRDYWLELMGDRKDLDTYSPRQNAARADAPILLIHGRDDTVVPYRHSQVMADALKDAGKPYKLVQLREEDHWLSRSPSRKQMLEEAVAFVQEHNPAD